MSKTTDTLAKMNELEERLTALREQMKADGQKTLEAAFKAFFADHPAVEKIGWTQYTPYFNDGDPCVFSLGEVSPHLHGDENEDFPYEGLCRYNYGDGPDPEQASWRASAELCETYKGVHPDFEALSSFISRNEDLMEALFGDHVMVVATADGITVDEYSHD